MNSFKLPRVHTVVLASSARGSRYGTNQRRWMPRIPGSFNVWGKEGPYGCAKFSSDSRDQCLVTRNVTHKTSQGLQFNELSCHGPAHATSLGAGSYLSVEALLKLIGQVCVVPFVDLAEMDAVADRHSASPTVVKSQCYGLCIGYGGNISAPAATRCRATPLLCVPHMLTKLANGENPKGVDTFQLKLLKELGLVYTRPSEGELGPSWPQAQHLPEEICCISCMEFPPQFRWKDCYHPHGKHGALICLRCCNFIRRETVGSLAIRGTAPTSLPCYICRRESAIVPAIVSSGRASVRMAALRE